MIYYTYPIVNKVLILISLNIKALALIFEDNG